MNSNISKLIASRTASLRLVTYTDEEERPYYSYYLITSDKASAFEACVENSMQDIEDIALLIYSGEGEPPEGMTEHILQHIVKPEYMADALASIPGKRVEETQEDD